jgi:hypothetical protein
MQQKNANAEIQQESQNIPVTTEPFKMALGTYLPTMHQYLRVSKLVDIWKPFLTLESNVIKIKFELLSLLWKVS